ncbi:MAG: hypothetical protein ABH883_01915 [Candidatus Omnitrophota bacterium]
MIQEGEYKNDVGAYGSIFNLETIETIEIKNGQKEKEVNPLFVVDNILNVIKARRKKDPAFDLSTVIVQLPKEFSNEINRAELNKLLEQAKGIKVMVIDTDGLKEDDNRAAYRRNMYSAMLLARHIKEDTPKDSKLYRLLEFFIETCVGEDKQNLISGYIDALMRNDIVKIVETVLSYRPMEKYDTPDYGKVAATLIAA